MWNDSFRIFQHRVLTLWVREEKIGEPTAAPARCLEAVSRPRRQRVKPSSPVSLQWGARSKWREVAAAGTYRVSRGASEREQAPGIRRGVTLELRLSTDLHTGTDLRGKNPPGAAEHFTMRLTQGWEAFVFPPAWGERPPSGVFRRRSLLIEPHLSSGTKEAQN